MQTVMNPEPRPVSLPRAEIVIDTLPMRQVMGQRAPCATASDEILKSVDDLSKRVAAMSAARLLSWEQGLQNLPLSVAQVTRVWPSVNGHGLSSRAMRLSRRGIITLTLYSPPFLKASYTTLQNR